MFPSSPPVIFPLVFVFLCLIATLSSADSNNNRAIGDVLTGREVALDHLIQAAETALLEQCSRVSSWSPSTTPCQIPACGNHFPPSYGYSCSKRFGVDEKTCGSGSQVYCSGLSRSESSGAVLFAPLTSNSDLRAQGFLAYSPSLDAAASAELASGRIKAWVGFGSTTGAYRLFPGAPRERDLTNGVCKSYDARLRPWYAAGSAGPKDVILVLDTSGSLFQTDCRGCKSRLQLLQNAAHALLDTLTFNDYFAVVTFNDPESGKIITAGGEVTLLQGTDANKATASDAITNLRPSGMTNFETGFKKAFEIFRATHRSTRSSNCSRALVLLTDGKPNDEATIDGYVEAEQATLGSNPAHIFSFTMSSGASLEKPRSLSCRNQGLHQHIDNGVNPLNAMAQYYKFLALANSNATAPRWTEPYSDAFGLGWMTTVARPVFDRSNGQTNFAGVIATDVPIDELLEIGSEQDVARELFSRSSSCPNVNFSSCFLQMLRNESGYECPFPEPSFADCLAAGNVTKVIECASFSHSPSVANPIRSAGGLNAQLCEAVDFSTRLSVSGAVSYADAACCNCALRQSVIVGVAVGTGGFVVLVGGSIVAVYYFWYVRPKDNNNNDGADNNIDEGNAKEKDSNKDVEAQPQQQHDNVNVTTSTNVVSVQNCYAEVE